jgi:hypothetical protein
MLMISVLRMGTIELGLETSQRIEHASKAGRVRRERIDVARRRRWQIPPLDESR